MAAINFPNPNNQAPLNQYGPESVAASLNGVTYSWSNDNVWYAQPTTANFGDIYVERTGSNMTGNLTFNTDKITLTALDGSALFAGYATFGNAAVNNSKVYLLGSAAAAIQVEDTSGTQTVNISQSGAATFAGGDISLNADGSITADGYIESADKLQIKSASLDGGTPAIYVYQSGGNPYFTVSQNGGVKIGGNASLLQDLANITLNADGSATFGGTLSVESTGAATVTYRKTVGSPGTELEFAL